MQSQAEAGGRQEPGAALMEKLGAIADTDERRALLRDNFQACDDPAMQYLAAKLQAGAEGHWQALLSDLQSLMSERLEAGKGLLMDLLASGEINVLDRKIVEKVKSGECDPSFLNVLQINLQDASQNQDQEDASQVGGCWPAVAAAGQGVPANAQPLHVATVAACLDAESARAACARQLTIARTAAAASVDAHLHARARGAREEGQACHGPAAQIAAYDRRGLDAARSRQLARGSVLYQPPTCPACPMCCWCLVAPTCLFAHASRPDV